MKARKDNKVYNIDASQKKYYLNEGYDIFDDKGKLIENSPKKKIEFGVYSKVVEANKELEKKVAELTDALASADVEKVAGLEKSNAELTTTNAELTDANKKITAEKAELDKLLKEANKELEKLKK